MKLYGSLTSPYVRKVRILLAEKDLPYTFVESNPSLDNHVLAALNPLGKVPALQLANGDVLIDSGLQVEYIDSLSDPKLIPDADSRWQVLCWHELGNGICDAVVARMLELRRPAECQSSDTLKKQEFKVQRALQYAEQRINNQEFLTGKNLSLADISLAVGLEYIDLRYAHDWRSSFPETGAWLAGISRRPTFMSTTAPQD